MTDEDLKLQRGAYITDGTDLYEVLGLRRGPGAMGIRTVRILVQNCRSFRALEFVPDKVRSAFNLVKAPPAGTCPDLVEDIAW